MQRYWSKSLFYIGSLLACSIMALTTGCVSGGFKLTRQYARWVNSQNIIIRIILYILTSVVFAVTLLVDSVIFNTMDFWEGKVSEGKYEFKEGEKTYQVHHEIQPGTRLKRSTIKVVSPDQSLLQHIVLNETLTGEVEMMVDGKLRGRVQNMTSIPVATLFDEKGNVVEEKVLLPNSPIFNGQFLARH